MSSTSAPAGSACTTAAPVWTWTAVRWRRFRPLLHPPRPRPRMRRRQSRHQGSRHQGSAWRPHWEPCQAAATHHPRKSVASPEAGWERQRQGRCQLKYTGYYARYGYAQLLVWETSSLAVRFGSISFDHLSPLHKLSQQPQPLEVSSHCLQL
jgi:hypothetical protein|eukprot:COSAG06_NODE_24609_length_657_cov_1.774194_2_plen_152_part_00